MNSPRKCHGRTDQFGPPAVDAPCFTTPLWMGPSGMAGDSMGQLSFSGVGKMSQLLGILDITKPNICWRWNIPNRWVMWNIGTLTNPCYLSHHTVQMATPMQTMDILRFCLCLVASPSNLNDQVEQMVAAQNIANWVSRKVGLNTQDDQVPWVRLWLCWSKLILFMLRTAGQRTPRWPEIWMMSPVGSGLGMNPAFN